MPTPPPSDDAPSGIDLPRDALVTRAALAFADGLARYHRHEIDHLDRLEKAFASGRRVVLVGNHALDIVDPLLLLARVFEELGRAPHFVAHTAWLELPGLREIARVAQVIASREPEATLAALRESGFLMLFPGGNREAALRDYEEQPYTLDWRDRKGFLRLALEADADILFAAAVGNDEAYYQSRLPTPDALVKLVAREGDAERYRGARLGFGLLGPHLIPGLVPLPVRITHVLSEPLDLGDRDRALADPAAFDALHAHVWATCQGFLDEAVEERRSDPLDELVRAGQRALRSFGF